MAEAPSLCFGFGQALIIIARSSNVSAAMSAIGIHGVFARASEKDAARLPFLGNFQDRAWFKEKLLDQGLPECIAKALNYAFVCMYQPTLAPIFEGGLRSNSKCLGRMPATQRYYLKVVWW